MRGSSYKWHTSEIPANHGVYGYTSHHSCSAPEKSGSRGAGLLVGHFVSNLAEYCIDSIASKVPSVLMIFAQSMSRDT